MKIIYLPKSLHFAKVIVILWLMVIPTGVQSAPILLMNNAELLPLKRLDTLSLNLVTLGISGKSKIREDISFYKPLKGIYDGFSSLQNLKLSSDDVFLIFTSSAETSKLETILSQLEGCRVVLCYVNQSPNKSQDLDGLIYVDERTVDDLSLCVQAIFGARAFSGELTRFIGDFSPGDGIRTLGNQRLLLPGALEKLQYQALRDTVARIIESGINGLAYPGAQLLVAHKDMVVVNESFGYHTYDRKISVENDHLYDLASVTKVTTAVPSLMYLLDHKMIDLDAPLCSYFKEFCSKDKRDITLRMALAHYGRLMPYIVYWQNTIKKNGKYRSRSFRTAPHKNYPIKITDSLYLHQKYKRKIGKAIKKSVLNADPGYVYSGLTFLLYPDLVKEKLGIRIDSFLYQNFYDRLGAESLRYRPLDRFDIDKIAPAEIDTIFRHQLVHGSVHDEAAAMLDGISCNAGLFSNATDLAKLCQLYLMEGFYGGESYFSKEIMNEFTRCQYCEEGNRRGLGFDKPMLEYDKRYSYVAESASPASFGHSGFTGTFFWIDPEAQMFMVLLTNRVYPTRDSRALYSLGIRPGLHQAIYDFLDGRK